MFFRRCCNVANLKTLDCKLNHWAAVCMSSHFLLNVQSNNNNSNKKKASGLALIDVTGWDAVILTALDRQHQPYITSSSSNWDSWQLWAEKPRSSTHTGGSETFLKEGNKKKRKKNVGATYQSQPHLMGWCVQQSFISGEDGTRVWGNRLLAHPSSNHPVSTFLPVNKDNYTANELRKKGLSDWYSQWGN